MACETTLLNTRYFVAKCANMDALRRCISGRKWASRPRLLPPQPHEVLSSAFSQGPVVLVFSVNNHHGWHGYCQMLSPPQQSDLVASAGDRNSDYQLQQYTNLQQEPNATNVVRESDTGPRHGHIEVKSEDTVGNQTNSSISHESVSGGLIETVTPLQEEKTENIVSVSCSASSKHSETVITTADCDRTADMNKPYVNCSDETMQENTNKCHVEAADTWHYFEVDWKTEFCSSFGEKCLPSSKTSPFLLPDGSPINKARNWQEISSDVGIQVCQLLDRMYADLVEERDKIEKAKLADRPPPFISMAGDVQENSAQYWSNVVAKVENELGLVHLACPFGSQRYNVQQPNSDIDAFIIYQAHTKDILSLNPPKLTLKNSEHDACDYTVLEIKRYCELLLSYDARCVETLFLHDSTIVKCTEEWRRLQSLRQEFLTRKCLDKYLGDALGSHGIKKLDRIKDSDKLNTEQPPPAPVAKLIYIIVRLLQNSADIVKGQHLQVFRPAGSAERDLLLKIRHANITLDEAMTIIKRFQEEINQDKDSVPAEMSTTKAHVESWLLQLRYQDFQAYPPSV